MYLGMYVTCELCTRYFGRLKGVFMLNLTERPAFADTCHNLSHLRRTFHSFLGFSSSKACRSGPSSYDRLCLSRAAGGSHFAPTARPPHAFPQLRFCICRFGFPRTGPLLRTFCFLLLPNLLNHINHHSSFQSLFLLISRTLWILSLLQTLSTTCIVVPTLWIPHAIGQIEIGSTIFDN